MKCPHCAQHFHQSWTEYGVAHGSQVTGWTYRTVQCAACKKWTIEIKANTAPAWKQVEPIGSTRGPTPSDIPRDIAIDYEEACLVLPYSAKASAALSRRCLQNILHAQGYVAKDLAKEIDAILNETDAKKALPQALRDTIDSIRNFGNFSAHPITDKTSLQVVPVDEHEAEWCLDILEELFQHFYVGPEQARQKKRALNQKLAGAGKPAAK